MRDDGIAGATAIVTGAGRGIGLAVARELHARGATVAALDRSTDELASHIDQPRFTAITADVTDPDRVHEVVSQVEHDLGPIDILVNVAGVRKHAQQVCFASEPY